MKVLTLVGTRPELIRLCMIIEKLDKLVDHVLVYTNQNYDPNLSTIFFEDLKIREPNYYFSHEAPGLGAFMSESFREFSAVLSLEKPDRVLVLGDTNSGLLAMLAAKQGIPVYHMEAGNRCFDTRVPEETNRKIIDSFSKYNLPYTENSKQNLLNEGYHKNQVFKTGNPIYEVLNKFKAEIYKSPILDVLGVEKQKYVLVTAHRAENVDDSDSLYNILQALNYIAKEYTVIFSVHPRTKSKIEGRRLSNNIILSAPFGFFDFVALETNAAVVVSDSGTVQEECCILGIPSMTIRKTTERQETIECGSNALVGTNCDDIITNFKSILDRGKDWAVPEEYLAENVSDIVINILLGRS
jgi:UDP-N-acetylglucosamine 2-epimerase (non-hydrolysing)